MISIILPYIISFAIGCLLVSILSHKEKEVDSSLVFFIGGGFGIGLSAHLTFLSYILMGEFNRLFVIASNCALLVILIIIKIVLIKKVKVPKEHNPKTLFSSTIFPSLLFIILMLPLIYEASFYVHGGWDAWATWNFKARFLFLSGPEWKNMFDPILWRSSPHYPLLLPMAIVWGWSIVNNTTFYVPMITSLSLAFLCIGMLFAGLKKLTKTWFALVPSIFLVTLPFFSKMVYSQYCDLFFGYYLLTSFACIILAKEKDSPVFSMLAGISLGFLTFTKTEGIISAAMMSFLSIIYISLKNNSANKKDILKTFIIATLISCIPTLIFKIFYSPSNITFSNGLLGQGTEHINLLRFKTVFAFYFFELLSPVWNMIVFMKNHAVGFEYIELKWHGIWMLCFLGLILSWRRCFNSRNIILGAFFILYNAALISYYIINTHFKIDWWVQVTLHRVLFAVLPTFLFWTFLSLWSEKN